MAKFKITYLQPKQGQSGVEVVEADFYEDVGEWIQFLRRRPDEMVTVLRVRQAAVERIEEVPDSN